MYAVLDMLTQETVKRMAAFGSTVTSPYDATDQDCKDEWDSWEAQAQEGNECLTFKRMLPQLGPKPLPGA